LLVFGKRAGEAAAAFARACPDQPAIDPDAVEEVAGALLAPFETRGAENPYAIHADLENCMQDLVGIIRVESELQQALVELERLKSRLACVRVEGNRHFNPGWHLALDLRSMLTVSEAVTRAALARKESRGGHTRSDYPDTDPRLARINLVVRRCDGQMSLAEEPLPSLPDDLQQLLAEGGH
jgi:succinate dehydrogenase / fumarate reductase flavoprotein subunit